MLIVIDYPSVIQRRLTQHLLNRILVVQHPMILEHILIQLGPACALIHIQLLKTGWNLLSFLTVGVTQSFLRSFVNPLELFTFMTAFHFNIVITPSSSWPLLPASLVFPWYRMNTEEEPSPFPLFASRQLSVGQRSSFQFIYLFLLAFINYTN